jgi:hypothetical protein
MMLGLKGWMVASEEFHSDGSSHVISGGASKTVVLLNA